MIPHFNFSIRQSTLLRIYVGGECVSMLQSIQINFSTQHMGLYQYILGFLSIAGYLMLTYRSVFQLMVEKSRLPDILQSLCIKWIILLLFIHFESTIASILQILPFGTLAVIVIKFLLILPENTLAMAIYKRFEKYLEKIQFEEYSSWVTVHASSGIKFMTIKLINLIQKMVIYINAHQIQEVEGSILALLKAIEYKKTAVQVRNEVGRSVYRRQFTRSDSLNDTVESIDQNQARGLAAPTTDKPLQSPRVGLRKTEIGQRISKILVDIDDQHNYRIEARQMVIKPNKQTGQKAVYETIQIQFQPKSKDIIFVNKHGATQRDKLFEMKYVTKDMMILELILAQTPSKVVKLLKQDEVISWVKPVVEALSV